MSDIHAKDRFIPPGMVLTAHALPAGETFARPGVLATRDAWASTGRATAVGLVECEAGWALAGSCLRWDNGWYGIRYELRDGTGHSRRFKTLDEARAVFDRLPD